MAQTAGQIITRATQIAKCPNYTAQAAGELNAILGDLCEFYDFAAARGLFSFTFNSQASSLIGGQNIFASGPYYLPLDYLRTSGSSGSEGTQKSAIWYLDGVPYPMIPCDLAEFDMQVQQAGNSSYPWIWATDMAQRQIQLITTGNVISSNTLGQLASNAIIHVGSFVQGPGIAPGTTVTSISAGQVTLSLPATMTNTVGGNTYTFGMPGVAYVYPPPSSNSNVNLRYQRQIPPMPTDSSGNLTAEGSNRIPWFPNVGYLETELAGRLMQITDDSRVIEYLGDGARRGRAAAMLDSYLMLKDDDANRAKTVQLDRRRFGHQFPKLRNTKTIGW